MEKRELITNINSESACVSVAGRIMSVRKMKNFCFCDVSDVSGRIQIIIPTASKLHLPDVGDIVLVSGITQTTKSGQLSINSSKLQVLSKGNTDVANAIKSASTVGLEIHGQRSLNLIVNDDLKKMIKARSIFISIIRDHFRTSGFMDIDTPVMSFSRFAGTADVFETKSRTLDRSLYLRGTLEDYLKQLVVAGFEKVFQIGDCFRNESPALIEFTMLEATWAYGTSAQMLKLIQDLISCVCNQLPDELVDPVMKKELSKKIEVVTFWGVLEKYFGVDVRILESSQVQEMAKKEGYSFSNGEHYDYELAKFGYDVIKRKLAKDLESPTFIGRFPACISPLAKEIQDGRGEADRGYGFFKGQRLFEIVEEANDYQEQMNKFQIQDDRSHRKIHSFKHDDLLTSLSYGCPPMAGLGFNVNRVLAVLLDVTRTSDVVSFALTSAALPL